ncbi:transcriptional regulator [Ciceribacter naphthalenivorans]|uniref:Transcriptional regulator n=3 Tax=Pseudomonadota TaxID=1224 RepID=A0A512HM24_9HYPH|nr:transcriptional regulator [Ciceribacter naphthalenivorans]GLR23853.1 transcriptional regulator [Ciceribacter naphthalenivorans]GLT06709.1 transcriptional regulator [Sphingomonas psychrolutea]
MQFNRNFLAFISVGQELMDHAIARTFLEVVKAGTFVGAAEALNISQTAVSARIRVLEEQLERPVFVRNKAGARLTSAGEKFLPFASSLVRVWETARDVVALPPGRSVLVSLGAELSLWSPLLSQWLLWMRRECPDIAVRTAIDTGEHLLAVMQEGGLDAAVIYGAPRRPGLVAELLFEERLVFAQTPAQTGSKEFIGIDWGADFAASLRATFPESVSPAVSIGYGPLALDYVLAVGGAGYFREGFIRRHLEDGRLQIVPDSPAFAYPAYLVSSEKADPSLLRRLREGLRVAAAGAD